MQWNPTAPAVREKPGRVHAALVLGVTLLAVSAVTGVFGIPLPRRAAVAIVGLGCTLYGSSALLASGHYGDLLRWIGVVVVFLGVLTWLSAP
jgi:hypothetical protein